MKSIGLIAVLVVLATATGCRKEEIRPMTEPQSPQSVSALRSASAPGSGTETEGTVGDGVFGNPDGGGITDPNSDPSGDKKKKQ